MKNLNEEGYAESEGKSEEEDYEEGSRCLGQGWYLIGSGIES